MRGAIVKAALLAFLASMTLSVSACWGDEEDAVPRTTSPTYVTNNYYYGNGNSYRPRGSHRSRHWH